MQTTDLKNIFNTIKPQGTVASVDSLSPKTANPLQNAEFMNMLDGVLQGNNTQGLSQVIGAAEQQDQLLSLLQNGDNATKAEIQELLTVVKNNSGNPVQMQEGIEQLLNEKPQLREVLANTIDQAGGFEKYFDKVQDKQLNQQNQQNQLNQLLGSIEKQNPTVAKKINPYQKTEMTEDMERVIKPKRNPFFVNQKQSSLTPAPQTGDVNNIRKMAVQQTVGQDGLTSLNNLQNVGNGKNRFVNQYAKDQGNIETNILRPDFPKNTVSATNNQNVGSVVMKDDVAVMAEANTTEQESVVLPLNKLESTPITNNSAKVMNITNLGNVNNVELIDKIADYVKQTSLQNRQNLDLMVQHDALGKFKVSVSKLRHAGNHLDMKVVASSGQGHAFFVENQSALVKSLSDAGITVTGLKVLASADFGITANNESREFSMNSNDGSSKEFNFTSNKRDSQDADAQRRKELWEEYKERYGT